MNVIKLNEYLSGNVDAIIKILEALTLSNISYNKLRHEIRCSREAGRNPTSVKIDTNTLFYKCFSTNKRGSIYSLVMERLYKTFPESLYWIADLLELEHRTFKSEIILPFGGYYKDLLKENEEPELHLTTYDDIILEPYISHANSMFLNDGISVRTQEKFKIGYDLESMRITVPQWDMNGKLIGIMGRLNEYDCPTEQRWYPIVPCPRSLTLYGYHMNYEAIQQGRTCLLVESEKSVMQLDSMGYNFGLATCTSSISDVQARYTKALMVENLIVGFDEGIDEESIRDSALKLKMKNPVFGNRVGYIYDKEHEILPAGSKASPTDLGKEAFKELMKTKVKWL